ncbi:MAG TPA: DUF2277 domain-containing protein [Bryobacteraceae bacterium]|nr:DUF2277 domain-containing protein [Bryobacteraceae bacterium]
MCRSIKVLRRPEAAATRDELSAAALQYVRKISGFRKPSKANQEAFDKAVREITDAGERLMQAIERDSRGRDTRSGVPLPAEAQT